MSIASKANVKSQHLIKKKVLSNLLSVMPFRHFDSRYQLYGFIGLCKFSFWGFSEFYFWTFRSKKEIKLSFSMLSKLLFSYFDTATIIFTSWYPRALPMNALLLLVHSFNLFITSTLVYFKINFCKASPALDSKVINSDSCELL